MMRSDLIDIREAHRLNKARCANIIRSLRAIPYHPVCANKEREHFLSGAATPPNLGGEFGLTFRYMTYLWAKRELEDIDALLLTKSSGSSRLRRSLSKYRGQERQ